ncbi:hypothetical protein [Flavobacterium sp.]|uniref:hypothetical protein n=1 Tax=Flavobacterium sp. TaxID=239 RepID=UPI004048EA80
MKKFIIIFSIILFSCTSITKKSFDNSNCNFDDSILLIDTILNMSLIDKQKLDIEGGIIIKENDTEKISISRGYGGYDKRYRNKNITKLLNYDIETLKVVNSYSFYEKGNFNIGNEYFYNEKGEIIKTINHNQYDKFPICYKEIIRATTKKAGKKFNFQGLERDSLDTNNEKIYFWKVYFRDSITIAPTLRHKFFKIDAKTNKTLEENTF